MQLRQHGNQSMVAVSANHSERRHELGLRYQHQFRPSSNNNGFAQNTPQVDGPYLITNFMAYNHDNRGFFPQD